MKKILLVAYDLNPVLGSEAGIAHKILLAILEYYSVDVFVQDSHRKDIEQFNYGGNVHFNFINNNSMVPRFYNYLHLYNLSYNCFIKKIHVIFKKNNLKFGLIHYLTPSGIHSFNSLYKTSTLPYIIGPIGGGLMTPPHFENMFTLRGKIEDKCRTIFYSLIIRIRSWKEYFTNARRILVGTDYVLSLLPSLAKKKAEVFFDTVIDINDFNTIKRVREKKIVQILYVGRLASIKGILLLIKAINMIKKENDEIYSKIRVSVFGDGPLKKQVQKLINKNRIHSVIYLFGKVPRSQILSALKKGDIFCLPTIRDNGCGAILEAMASGLPIITSNYGGPKYSVTDECGIKIEVNNYQQYVENLASAIIKLVSDENLRIQMGLKGQERVARFFSLHSIQKKITKIYEGVWD